MLIRYKAQNQGEASEALNGFGLYEDIFMEKKYIKYILQEMHLLSTCKYFLICQEMHLVSSCKYFCTSLTLCVLSPSLRPFHVCLQRNHIQFENQFIQGGGDDDDFDDDDDDDDDDSKVMQKSIGDGQSGEGSDPARPTCRGGKEQRLSR